MIAKLAELLRDESGRGALKLVFGCCLLALAGASASPAFEANPFISQTVKDMRHHLPETLDKITHAMGG